MKPYTFILKSTLSLFIVLAGLLLLPKNTYSFVPGADCDSSTVYCGLPAGGASPNECTDSCSVDNEGYVVVYCEDGTCAGPTQGGCYRSVRCGHECSDRPECCSY